MSGYIKYFVNGSKNMSFRIKDVDICLKIMKFGIKFKVY